MKKQNMNTAFGMRFSVIILCVVVMAFAIIFSIGKIKETKAYVAEMQTAVDTLYTAEIGHLKWASNLNSAIEYGTKFTGSTDERECVLGKHIYSETVQNDAALAESVGKIEPIHKKIHQLAIETIETASVDKRAAEELYSQEVQKNIDELLVLLDSSIAARQAQAAVAESQLDSIVSATFFVAVVLMAATLIACINMYSYIKRQIGRPILHIAKTAEKLALGELNVDFTNNSRNEVGELGILLNTSVHTIAVYIEDIDRAMAEFSHGNFNVMPAQPFIGDFKNIENSIADFIVNMSDTLRTIANASGQVYCGAEQISNGAQSLAQGATEQASGIEELSATINELSVQVRQTSDNFKEINDIIISTCEQVSDGSEKMLEMTHAMDDIIEFSRKIRNIIKTIDDITFQTNILALNAAVEAARAGAAGKGFAVVADEVRNLAQKSANAASNITELIENSINVVNKGAFLTGESADVFKNIVDMSAKITAKVESAFSAAEDQAIAINQIVLGIEQISSVVQTNSATSEESAAASEELHGQSQILQSLVAKFMLFTGKE